MLKVKKALDVIEVVSAIEGETLQKTKKALIAIDAINAIQAGTLPKIKRSIELMDAINAIDLITPQLEFLAGVLCFTDVEITTREMGGLSSILYSISKQLQDAVREDTNADT